MKTLLWKEWREHVWKLAFGTVILCAFAVIGLRARVIADDALLAGICIMAVLLLPMLASTGLIPAERSDGTLETLLALPVPPARIFAAKTIMGVVLCVGPLLAAAVFSIAMAGGREMTTGAIAILFIRAMASTLALLFWMICATVNLPSETRAALIALGIQVVWLVITLPWFVEWSQKTISSPMWVFSPYAFLLDLNELEAATVARLAILLVVQGGVAALLWWFTARKFGAIREGRS